MDVRRVWRWTITTAAALGTAGGVSAFGLAFSSWDQSWVQAAAGLAAAIVMAPLCVWAAGPNVIAPARDDSPALPIARDVPIPPNAEYVARERLFADISARLTNSGAVVVQALQGMGGVGKTQLAAHYTHSHWTEYRIVWWIPAEDPSLIGVRLAQLGAALGVANPTDDPSAALTRVMMHLNTTSDWLLIFDNAESPADLQSWLPSGGGHVLITSRAGGWSHLGNSVEIREMDRGESISLIHRRHPGLSHQDADRLAAGLGDLPLALVQAAGFMQSSGTAVDAYLHMVERFAAEVMLHGPVGGHDGTLAASVRLSVQRLETIDSAGMRLLQMCAFLSPEPIPDRWLIDSDLVTHDPPASAELTLRRSISMFTTLGLATIAGGGIQLHRLTRAIIIDLIDPDDRTTVRGQAHSLLNRERPESTDDSALWPQWAQLVPHLLATDPAEVEDPRTRRTACDAARYLLKSGQSVAGHQLATALYTAWRSRLGQDHPDALRAAQQLAHAHRVRGEYQQALELNQDTLTRRNRILGEDHPDSLWSASNLAVDFRQLGDYGEAREIDEDTLARRQRILGEDHPDTLSSASNLAVDLRQLGDYERALEIDESTLARRRRILGESHPDTLDSENNLAIDLLKMGRYQQAREINEDTLTRRREILGESHPDTLWTASNLSVCLRHLGQYERAREINEDTLARRRRVLGDDHPDTLRSASHLAVDLRHLGRYERAREINEDTLARRRRVLGDDHPDTLRSVRNLAISMRGPSEPCGGTDQG